MKYKNNNKLFINIRNNIKNKKINKMLYKSKQEKQLLKNN